MINPECYNEPDLEHAYAERLRRVNMDIYTKLGWKICGMHSPEEFQRLLRQFFGNDPLTNRAGVRIVDHAYFIRDKEGVLHFITEPYDFDIHSARRLIAFCEKHDMEFYIGHNSKSLHYPNNSVSIRLSKKPKEGLIE